MNRTWTLVGYFGAAVLSAVSLIANLRYGLSLARHPLDQATYAGAGIAIDLLKALLPLVALRLWSDRHRLVAAASAALWLGCLTWSLGNAIGFSLATRAEANAERSTEMVAHAGWVTTVDRTERQLSALGNARPVAAVKADLEAANVPAAVWARTKECSAITLPGSYAACAAVVSLRRELAVAEVAERLEQSLAAGHTELRATKAGPAEIDPQATALARLAGVDESSVRMGLALLLAAVVEAGSALGFTIVALATRAVPAPPRRPGRAMSAAIPDVRPASAVGRPKHRNRRFLQTIDTPIDGGRKTQNPTNIHGEVNSFLQARTIGVEGATFGATELYRAYQSFCRSQGFAEPSQQALGRALTRLGLDKGRCTRTGRIAYIGMTLNDQNQPTTKAARSHPTLPSDPKFQRGTARLLNGGAADRKVRDEGFATLGDRATGTA